MSTLFGAKPAQTTTFSSPFGVTQSLQQQQQQPPQTQQQSQSQPNQQVQSTVQPINTQQNQQQYPTWFQNQKKRTIPNHLVPKKKPSFQLGTNNNNSKNKKSNSLHPSLISDDQFNLLSFGSNNRRTIAGPGSILDKNTSVGSLFDSQLSSNTTIGDLTKIDDTFDGSSDPIETDLPPKKSMFDLGTESAKILTSDTKFDSFIHKDPKSFSNIFNRSNFEGTKAEKTKSEDKDNAKINHLKNYNLAIVVFGYPESLSIEIIKFFESFGRILENFTDSSNNLNSTLLNLSTSQNSTNGKVVPIYSGKHWVKLTYDNPNSALQALQENGNVFNGSIIGVVPYHKSIIEKLEKKKIFANDDIGDGDLDIPLDKINEIINQQSKIINNQEVGSIGAQTNGDAAPATSNSYVNRLDIKPADGHFFLKDDQNKDASKTEKPNETKTQENLGLLGTLSKYVFGFHDL